MSRGRLPVAQPTLFGNQTDGFYATLSIPL